MLTPYSMDARTDMTGFTGPNQTRGHGFKLYKQFSSSTVGSSFFAQRVVNVWNSLQTSVDFSALSAFSDRFNVLI